MKYAYYPGCSLETSAKEYDVSSRAVFRAMGSELVDIEDWCCCGSSPAEAVDYLMSLALPARSLATAERMGYDTVVATCSACYLSLYQVGPHLERDPQVRAEVDEILEAAGLEYHGTVKVRHMLDVVANDFGPEAIQKHLKRELSGLKVIPYYGCQTVRPYMTYDAPDLPMTMDRVLEALGAEVMPYHHKTRCCGGITITSAKDVGVKLVSDLLAAAEGADCVATVCPLCQMNLDAYQADVSRVLGRPIHMPVLFLPQLMGLAFDLPAEELLLNKNIASTQPVLDKLGL
ncbi:MAG: CoB--CoM heterodisulfide reductase iron-sulfur subunit B family protein [Chloroflexia bacterium]|nr:CoB--CoM heterodisulfide reductase iron-sulfur subunit B family protein [Chloroflexia bacterium]